MGVHGIAEIIVAKHRNGPTGSVELSVSDAHGRFRSVDRRVVESPA
ncbi:MAG: hypothetical protein IIC29_07170 [Chloroflexi bacterium]|nr:hypothetical protein [Chloroflexota bacterium]